MIAWYMCVCVVFDCRSVCVLDATCVFECYSTMYVHGVSACVRVRVSACVCHHEEPLRTREGEATKKGSPLKS